MKGIPTREQLEKLPLRAQIAFAARCARRVELVVPTRRPAFSEACQVLERYAAGDDSSLAFLEVMAGREALGADVHVAQVLSAATAAAIAAAESKKEERRAEFIRRNSYAEANAQVYRCCTESDPYGERERGLLSESAPRKRWHGLQTLRKRRESRLRQVPVRLLPPWFRRLPPWDTMARPWERVLAETTRS